MEGKEGEGISGGGQTGGKEGSREKGGVQEGESKMRRQVGHG